MSDRNPLLDNVKETTQEKIDQAVPKKAAQIPTGVNPMSDMLAGMKAKGNNPLGNSSASPLSSSASPLKEKSEYTIEFDEFEQVSEEIQKIAAKRVEDMTQEELRQIYFNIKGKIGDHLYSASEINDIEKYGESRSNFKASDSLFIGDQVHKAMEVNGANLSRLKSYGDLGEEPTEPDLGLTKGEMEMLAIIAQGVDRREAIWNIRSNKATKAVSAATLTKYRNVNFSEMEEEAYKELPKEIVALEKMVEKETGKITKDHVDEYQKYMGRAKLFNHRKSKLAGPDDLIVDNLPYRKMGAERVIATIKKTYEALTNSKAVMDLYTKGFTGKGEAFTEHVVLWKYMLPSGKEVKCKSMFDKMVIDKESKVLSILDIKTHSKSKFYFINDNYFGYSYYRSMAFYRAAAEYILTQDGHDLSEWTIRVALLPVSTAYGEVGCYFDYSELSNCDMDAGTNGGFLKPFGTKYDEEGKVQTFLNYQQYTWLSSGGLIHPRSRDLHRKGWKEIVGNYEKKISNRIL